MENCGLSASSGARTEGVRFSGVPAASSAAGNALWLADADRGRVYDDRHVQLRKAGITARGSEGKHGWYLDLADNRGAVRFETNGPDDQPNGTGRLLPEGSREQRQRAGSRLSGWISSAHAKGRRAAARACALSSNRPGSSMIPTSSPHQAELKS